MPISDCEVRDPRIRRTRRLLQSALGTLMRKKSLEDISVQDISEEATLNRATFYDHYTDKYALLEAMVGGGFHQLLADRQIRFDANCTSAASAIILAVWDYLKQLESEASGSNQSSFTPLIDAAIIAAVSRIVRQGLAARPAASADMLTAAISWAIYGSVKQRFTAPKRPRPGTVVTDVLRVIQPMLQEN